MVECDEPQRRSFAWRTCVAMPRASSKRTWETNVVRFHVLRASARRKKRRPNCLRRGVRTSDVRNIRLTQTRLRNDCRKMQ